MSDITELEALVPDEIFVTVKGEEIEIKPFKFLNLLKVLKILFKMMDGVALEGLDQFSIVKMLAENPEETLKVFNIATSKPVNWFEDVDSAEGVDLITTIIKVNQDFFIRKLVPKLKSLNELSSSQSPETTLEPSETKEEELENLPKNELAEETKTKTPPEETPSQNP